MRLLHLYWPHLPLRLARARRSDSFPTDRPVVLGGQPWTDGTVIDADPAARALGVRRGIPLGSAHRLAPEAAFLDPEPDADAASRRGGLRDRSPGSARGSPASTDQADPAFGLLEVQVDGLERLWGDRAGARRAARRGPRRRSCRARRGRASPGPGSRRRSPPATRPRPSRGSSGPAARPRSSPRCRRRCSRRTRTSATGCARFGLRRIGAVAELPRSALVARFGEEGERLHARARGEEIEPVPAATRPGAPGARPADRAGRRRAGAAPVRPPPARRGAGRPARGPRHGRRPGPSPADARPHLRRSRARPGRSSSSSASPSRPPTPRRSSGSSSPASSGRRRRRRSRGSSWSWPASSRPSGSSCRCSCRRRPGTPGSAGSWPGSR